MLTLFIVIYAVASLCCGEERHPKQISPTLKWPDKYYVKGTLFLPYAELEEPFDAWYDGANNRSRVDMYGGVTKTLQLGDVGEYGRWYTVDPWSTETVRNELTCFIYNGTQNYTIEPQPMLPDVTDFKHIGDYPYKGSSVHVYQMKKEIGNKVNTYTLYVDTIKKLPVYYKMHGYNNVISSHYDEYIMQYDQVLTNYESDVFDSPIKGMKCHRFAGPINSTRILANPMQEYIHPIDDSHVHHMHQEFVEKYNKTVGQDHEERKNIFKHNLRYIHSINRKNLTYKLKVNHFADRTDGELKHLTGRLVTPREQRVGDVGKEFVATVSSENIPDEINWRHYGAVTQVKDQATCGSCWSFGVAGTIEAAYFLKTGKLLRLSQQQMVDCSWGFGNNGCYGGEDWRAYKYVMKHGGLATEEDYGQYLAIDGYCHDDKVQKIANISGYVYIPKGNEDVMKVALFQHGPVTVAMDVSQKTFTFYSNGVYYDPKCSKKWDDLGHQLLAVGYGTHEGEPYWLIKNSWSSHWGNDGYFLMSRKDNNCGILTDASYAIIN